jgi:hypothetical protein
MAGGLTVAVSEFAVAQFGGSIATNIMTLKDLWNRAKEVPAEVNSLLTQMESLNLLLQDMQADRSGEFIPQILPHNHRIQQGLKMCMD